MKFDILSYGTDKFILNGKQIVPEPNLLKWANWFQVENRVVAKTIIGGVEVSTVFLGLDHSYGHGPLQLFETMVFGGYVDRQERCSTWTQAEQQHERICAAMMITDQT